nr:unnamed protein product [Callosobruchus analis]
MDLNLILNKIFSLCRSLGLISITTSKIDIIPINNTIGLFFHEEGALKISNEKSKIPELKPSKINKLDVQDLNIAQHNLNRY